MAVWAAGRDFPSRILEAAERAAAAGEPLRAVGDEWGTPTYAADVADAIVELLAEDALGGIHHLVNGLIATRADWARDVVGAAGIEVEVEDVPMSTWERAVQPPAGASSRRRRCRPASRSAPGPTRWPTTPRLAARGAGAGRDAMTRAARRRCPASATAPSSGTATSAARSASCGGPATSTATDAHAFVQANLSTSAAGVLRGLHLHRRQDDLGRRRRARAFVALVDVRPMLDGSATRPLVETRELGADDWVVIPTGVAHGFLALEPLQLIYLVTNEYDGTDELGFAWDDPAVAVDWPSLAGTPDGARSCPSGTRRTRRWPTWWRACARGRADRGPHTDPPRYPTAPDPKGLAVSGPSRD